jgi:hypothetical protein
VSLDPVDPSSEGSRSDRGTARHAREDDATALRAERNALLRRCAAAERRVDELAAELEVTRARLAEREAELSRPAEPISIFADGAEDAAPVAGDGTDPRIVSLVLWATAIVCGMVTVLALLNGNLFTWFGAGIVLLTAGLGYAAVRTRVEPVTVHLTRGVVFAERGGTTYRFDLRSDSTRVEQRGRVGDGDWQIRFLHRSMDPLVIDATMVDPEEFLARLRAYRPEL